MSATSIIATALIAGCVAIATLAVAGVVCLRTTMQRLHAVALASVVMPWLGGAAVAFGTHATASQAGKGLLVALVMTLFAGVLSHETARAIESREGAD